ncbi:MAG: aminoacyl-tRNA hydrolase [Firmicutes bacterium]|nr:aminoacyl-tRNA hydrolase [Bacillota bacterium]
MKIIVGLGNPGTRYATTRHNLGFWVVDLLAARWQIALTKRKFQAVVGEGMVQGEKVLLVKPQTFMNRSGESVGPLVRFFGAPLSDLLVIYDDMALSPGVIRIRAAGSAGGHNGMKSLIAHLGSEGFPRLRLGIGAPPPELDSADYVLQGVSEAEHKILHEACVIAADAAELWLLEGVQPAMNMYNRKQKAAPDHGVESEGGN